MTARRNTAHRDRGNMSWAIIVSVLALALIAGFTSAVMSNIKRTAATKADIAITQHTDAAVAAAVAKLSAGQSLPSTRSAATTECQDVDNRYLCYSYWALPRPGNAADPLRYDLITRTWDDSQDRDRQPPTDGGHVRNVRYPLEAITYTGSPTSSGGRIVYDASPSGLFTNAMFGFGDVTLNGPDVEVRSYNSLAATSGTDNGTVATGAWVGYGRGVNVDNTRLYGTNATGSDRATRCTGEACLESDVVAMPHTYKRIATAADGGESGVAWMRNGTANAAVACTSTINGNWVASERSGRISTAVLCVNGSFIIDAPTTLTVAKATVVVHGNVIIEQSLNAPTSVHAWPVPSKLTIYSTGQAVTFNPKQSTAPGTGVAALLYAPRAVCSTDPASRDAGEPGDSDHTGTITYSGSLVCDTISIGGSWTHAYDDAIPVNFVDPVAANRAWVIGAPDVVDEADWEMPVGWDTPTCVPPRPVNATSWWRLTEPSGSIADDNAGNNDLGWLTSNRGESICGGTTKGARFITSGESAASERIVTSPTNGVTIEWWGRAPVGKITSAGVTVSVDSTRHVRVTAGGVTATFPFSVENHDKWHLYTVTVSHGGEAKLYVDGTVKKTVTVGSPAGGGRTAIGPGAGGSVSELVTYSRTLTATDVSNRWSAWNQAVVFTASSPGTPFGAPTLSDNGTTYGHLKVKWTTPTGTFPVGSSTSYRVQRATSQNGTYSDIAGTIASNVTTWASTSPAVGNQWYRACAVYNGDTVCGTSVKITAIPQLTAPTVTVSDVTTGSARFSWTSVTDANGYQYQVRTNGGAWSASTSATEANRSVTRSGQQGTKIEVRVRGLDIYGQPGPWSSIAVANLAIDSPKVDNWHQASDYPAIRYRGRYSGGNICAPGTVPDSRRRDQLTHWDYWNEWSDWAHEGHTGNATALWTSTVGNRGHGLGIQLDIRCKNTASGNTSPTIRVSTVMYHPIAAPTGLTLVIDKTNRRATWTATCEPGTDGPRFKYDITAAWGRAYIPDWANVTSYSRNANWGNGTATAAARCVAGSRAGVGIQTSKAF